LDLLGKWPLWRWLVLGLAVRVLLLLWYVQSNSNGVLVPLRYPWRPDAATDGHWQIARTLWTDGQFAYWAGGPAVHNRPPLPPVVMAAVGGHSAQHWYRYWFAFTVTLSLLGLGLVRGVLRRAGASAVGIGLVLAVYCLHPYLMATVRVTNFQVLAAVGLLGWAGVLWRLGQASGRMQWRWALGLGVLSGLLALTHGVLLPLLALGPLAIAFCPKLVRAQRLWLAGLCVVVGLGLVAPWTWRNWQTFGQVIPVATGAAGQYWKGSSWFRGMPDLEIRVHEAETGQPYAQIYFGPVNPQTEQVLARAMIKDILAQPGQALRYWSISGIFYWLPWDAGWLRAVMVGSLTLPSLLLGGWGLWQGRRPSDAPARQRRWWLWAVGLLLLGLGAAFTLLMGNVAYVAQSLPLLLLWAGVAAGANRPKQA
jgi:hypothetical protein